jgi:hypothetical protein
MCVLPYLGATKKLCKRNAQVSLGSHSHALPPARPLSSYVLFNNSHQTQRYEDDQAAEHEEAWREEQLLELGYCARRLFLRGAKQSWVSG